jgi:hypothetical protein
LSNQAKIGKTMKVYLLSEQVSPRKTQIRAIVDNENIADEIAALNGSTWHFTEYEVKSFATAQEFFHDQIREQTISKLTEEELASLRSYFSS